ELYSWADKLTTELQHDKTLADVNSDQQQAGLQTDLKIDRATAARLGLLPSTIDNTLYDAFGQRQVSTIYNPLNQYHVVMEVAPQYWQSPESLRDIYVSAGASPVPAGANPASGASTTTATPSTATTATPSTTTTGTPSTATTAT